MLGHSWRESPHLPKLRPRVKHSQNSACKQQPSPCSRRVRKLLRGAFSEFGSKATTVSGGLSRHVTSGCFRLERPQNFGRKPLPSRLLVHFHVASPDDPLLVCPRARSRVDTCRYARACASAYAHACAAANAHAYASAYACASAYAYAYAYAYAHAYAHAYAYDFTSAPPQ